VEVDVEVERPAEPLDRRDAPGPRFVRSEPSRAAPLPGEDGAGEEVERARGEPGMAGGEEPDAAREGDAAVEVGAERPLHEGGQAAGVRAPLPGTGEERLEPLAHHGVEQRPLRLAAAVSPERRARREGAALPGPGGLCLDTHAPPPGNGRARKWRRVLRNGSGNRSFRSASPAWRAARASSPDSTPSSK